MIMKREWLFEMQKHVNCRGKTSVNGGAFDGTKMHKKNIQKRVCDGVKKKKT